MIIHGLSKLTLLDYPGKLACTLFTGGCTFRCPFCQNAGLVLHPQSEPVVPDDELWAFLKKRRGRLQGVCISGGEPTLQPDLADFICRIRELGYAVKLDTNGYQPDVLEALLEENLLDAVAMDIKSSPEGYARAAGIAPEAFHLERIERSRNALMAFASTHPAFYLEFRTTLVRELHTEEDVRAMGAWIAGAPHYALQHFEDSEQVLTPGLSGFSREEMEHFATIAREYIADVQVRGI